jgi:glycosyltransferase involved in cell wall biosynthesis
LADGVVVNAGRIGVVLPSRESFTLKKSGAVALCARDFARHSRFRDRIVIMGAASCEYPDVRYLQFVGWRRWWRRSRTAYRIAVAEAARAQGCAALEIQNRPYMMAPLRRALPGVKLALYLLNDPQEMAGSRTVGERRRLLQAADAVWCISEWVRGRFLEGVDDPQRRATLIYPGVQVEAPAAAKERIVAFVGRVIPDKGVVELAQAFAVAAPLMPGWRLVVAGADPGRLLAPWRQRLGERLECLGQVSHAQALALFARAEIAAVPSVWREPFGRTAIEALASGCALVTSGRGGLAEIAESAAEVVAPEDAQAFAGTLRRLAGDPSLREALRKQGLARVGALFDIRVATARLDTERARLIGA